ncbi:MAG TPA: hypothetical protein VGA85_00015 [Dehalococcoidales bacterium]
MDKAKAIQTFLEHVEHLTRLPLITDTEMNTLYGEEVTAALEGLARLNEKEQFCQNCQTRCCPAVKCELYAPQFNRCPIYEFRPPICRLHYCHRFFADDDILLKEMSDIFFDSLLTVDKLGSAKARLFDCPPLTICCPDLITATAQWMNSVREGTLNSEVAIRLIQQKAEKYRTPAPQSPS